MKAVIFGIHGQDGFYLEKLLHSENIAVVGVSRSSGNWISGDVANRDFVQTLLKKERPDFVFHLAAESTTAHEAIWANHETISTGTLAILEGVRTFVPECRVFLAGSAMQFQNDGRPISEKTPFQAASPYAIARIQSVYAARYFRERFQLKVYVGYLFNHDSPFRSERHVNAKIVNAVKRIAGGSKEHLMIGAPDVRKEFNFAGDMVRAIWKLVNQEHFYEAVIGSGKAYRISDFLEICFSCFNLNWQDHVEKEEEFKPEYRILVSSPELIISSGWVPEVGIEDLARLMLFDQKG